MKAGPNIGSKTFGATEQIMKKAIAARAAPVLGLVLRTIRKLLTRKSAKPPMQIKRPIGLFNNGMMYPGMKIYVKK